MRLATVAFGTLGTVAMLIAALWGWQNATRVVASWSRPDVAANAVRCAAVALAAAAQLVLLFCVVGRAFTPGRADRMAGMLMAAMCAVATISAVALTLAGR